MYYVLMLAGIVCGLGVPYVFAWGVVGNHLILLWPPVLAVLSWAAFRGARRTRRHELVLEEAARATIEGRGASESVDARLAKLDDLKARGVVSGEEYERQRARILDEL